MASTQFNAPEVGTLVAGKYRVGGVVASGGMGVIVEAEHAALGQRVAIKFLRPEAEDNPEMVERFLREARAAARLESDHVVRVSDVGTDERGVPFLVMELLTGRDLGAEIAARGPLPVAEAVGYVVEALDAIVEAHAAGIVHRDLKPSNLFLVTRADGTRRVKVLDFGISKSGAVGVSDAALTSSRSMLGSPGYMSPEQVRSTKTVDGRTDLWALGVILYELLTGEPAFRGETLGDIFARIREEDLPPVRSRRADVPKDLAAVLSGCLQRDRSSRIADAVTLRARLQPFVEKSEPPSLAAPVRATAPSMTGSTTTRWDGTTQTTWMGDRISLRHGRFWIGAALASIAGVLGIWLSVRASSGRAAPLPAGPSATLQDGIAGVPSSPRAHGAVTMGNPVGVPQTPPGDGAASATGSPAPAMPASIPSPASTSAASAPVRGPDPPPDPRALHPGVHRTNDPRSLHPPSAPSAVPTVSVAAPPVKNEEDLGI